MTNHKNQNTKSTLVSIFGPTSSGKTALSIELATKIPNSIIINADSRQIYRGLDIGTGKTRGTWTSHPIYGNTYIANGIPHFLIDYIDPSIRYTLVDYIQDFKNFITTYNPKFVILVGGTGLYIDTITLKNSLSITKKEFLEASQSYIIKLKTTPLSELQKLIKQHDIKLNNSDYHNPRRLVNRLHETRGNEHNWFEKLEIPNFDYIHRFALKPDLSLLKNQISKRLNERYDSGLLAEIIELQSQLTETRILELGLEYRLGLLYLQGKLTENEFKNKLLTENQKLAKRQITWINTSNTKQITDLESIEKLLFSSPS
jgi:tRNA dimethylallyltransferase